MTLSVFNDKSNFTNPVGDLLFLMGNHDSACVGLEPPEVMMLCSNYDIDRQQRDQLSREAKEWLKSLPYVWSAGDGSFACAHGEFAQPRAFDYMESVLVAHKSFISRPEPLLFVGHTHHAEYFAMNPAGKVSKKLAASFHVRPGWRYLVNVGSVGYPRADLVTTYVIYDEERRRIMYRELPFDFKRYILDMIGRDGQYIWAKSLVDLLDDTRKAETWQALYLLANAIPDGANADVVALATRCRAEAAAIKAEEIRLRERRTRLGKKEERLMAILDRECNGEKTDLGVATVSYRKTNRMEITDSGEALFWLREFGYTDCYKTPAPEISKSEVKKLVKSGVEVPGCELVEDYSCSLR